MQFIKIRVAPEATPSDLVSPGFGMGSAAIRIVEALPAVGIQRDQFPALLTVTK